MVQCYEAAAWRNVAFFIMEFLNNECHGKN